MNLIDLSCATTQMYLNICSGESSGMMVELHRRGGTIWS